MEDMYRDDMYIPIHFSFSVLVEGTLFAQARHIVVGAVSSPFWPEHPSQCLVSTPGASLVLKFKNALITCH